MRFSRILVYLSRISGSDPALERAADLARASGSAIKLIHVVEATTSYYMRGVLPAEWKAREVIERKIEDGLKKRAAPLRKQGLDATTEVLFGRPALEITREVLKNGHDLVMKTAQGEGCALGMVATRLMRMCPCPVWVVDRGPRRKIERVLAAVDPEPDEKEQDVLNMRILELATSLSRVEEADLHVLHAWRDVSTYGWTVHGEDLFAGGLPEGELYEYRESVRRDASERLDALLSRAGVKLPETNRHLCEGSPAAVIPRFVQENGVGLLVMGTVARSGIKGFLMGNAAERILRKVECSVLAVKPGGFVSPVSLETTSPTASATNE